MADLMIDEECTNIDCEDETHPFPPEGARVRIKEDVETRQPGDDDCKPIMVRAGEQGIVLSYVVEWHDVHVALLTQDGQDVWIDCDNLELVK